MKKNCITRVWPARLPTKEGLSSHNHERLYTSGAKMDERRC